MNPTTDNRTAKVSDEVADEAGDWVIRRADGLTPMEEQEFQRWLVADSRHAVIFRETAAACHYLDGPRRAGRAGEVGGVVAPQVENHTRTQRRWFIGLATGLAAAAAIAVMIYLPSRAPVVSQGKVEVRPERRVLADGSVVELNASAEITTDFAPAERRVTLLRGEAHFDVTKNPSRPFIVSAGAVSVRAVGTAFAVRLDRTEVDVLVTEGRVVVQRHTDALGAAMAPASAEPIYLNAGGRVVMPAEALAVVPKVEPLTPVEIKTALGWRERRLEFTEMPLSQVLARFNHQNSIQLVVAHDVEDVPVSGVFWSDDPEGFSRLLEASAGLKAVRISANRIVLQRP